MKRRRRTDFFDLLGNGVIMLSGLGAAALGCVVGTAGSELTLLIQQVLCSSPH